MADDPVMITTVDEAKDAYRSRDLRQALYDAGEVVMGDVLVNLHGDDHRSRRRLENRLFRREVFFDYQERLFPAVIEETLKPHEAEGEAELVKLSHQLMMNLAALTAGVDRPLQTPEETFHLYNYLMTFIQGATLAHYTGDVDAKRAEVAEALEQFDEEFLEPSIAHRRDVLAQVEAGLTGEEDLPKDVLTLLLQGEEELGLTREIIRREVAFYLLAGAHTSATAFCRTLDHLFVWRRAHPEDANKIREDRLFLQRCVHETIRLFPSSPVAMRWALAPVELRSSGRQIPEGAKVVIDLMAINRDTDVWGDDAAEFNPYREVPAGLAPWGLSFGGGMHICIGQDLAAGVLPKGEVEDLSEHLYGLVPVAVQGMIDRGADIHPGDEPVMDATTKRPYWSRYPVAFGAD
ncbi:cytochrome P450 [Euzebya tangerina]|uniref:cytochrome P450 n=1 Tax=Euzebya tangerina TaxID=591198 RepID=UPI000E310E35|nr:cytochrome P450 [Euzebya tangerina]